MAALAPLESPTLTFPMTELLVRIHAGYVEMPGLKLTTPQARRLWGLDGATCDTALAALVNAKFLSRTPEGLFVMATPRSDQKASQRLAHDRRFRSSRRSRAFRGHTSRPSRDVVGRPTAIKEVGIDRIATGRLEYCAALPSDTIRARRTEQGA